MQVVPSWPTAAARAALASRCDVLAREDRLHPRSRVRSTIRRGRRVRSGCVVVHFVADDDRTRAAVVVGKNLGGSVARHHRQRQLRHALRAVWADLPSGSMVVRGLAGEADFDGLVQDLRRAVARL